MPPRLALLLFLTLLIPCLMMAPAPAYSEASQRIERGIGRPFHLVNGQGRDVTEKDFLGRYMLVFFGYTFCPDICPTRLQDAASALELAGPEIEKKVRLVFITIDPHRDTPQIADAYAKQFSPDAVGLSGSAQQIAAIAKAYGVYYARSAESGPDDEDYIMDHASFLYLVDDKGKFVDKLPSGLDAQALAQAISRPFASSSHP